MPGHSEPPEGRRTTRCSRDIRPYMHVKSRLMRLVTGRRKTGNDKSEHTGERKGAVMKWAVLGVVLALAASFSARADEPSYDDTTRCAQLNGDLSQQDKSGIADAIQYMQGVFTALDDNHMEAGDQGIVAQWSDEGMLHNIQAVAGWCDQHPQETVHNATAEVYEGLRSLEQALGAAK